MTDVPAKPRFLTIEQASEELNVSGELRAIQVGGRGLWRIGCQDIEDFITKAYRRTAEHIAAGEFRDNGEGCEK